MTSELWRQYRRRVTGKGFSGTACWPPVGHLRKFWPELASGDTPSPTIAEVLGTGALGVKNGRGLRGDYDETDAASLKERRDRVLAGLRALREA